MASFVKIGLIWIDFLQYELIDLHQCESSTILDNENEDDAQAVRRTNKESILKNICSNQISSVPSQNISPVGGIVISEPKETVMEGINNVSINNNDDEASIVDKGKGNMIQSNEELESSSSLEEEVLESASHFILFPHDALQFGEGASKFFEDGTDSRLELNIGEGILNKFY
ncbi:hypothetical protein MTR_1g029300 [Medicago truncatula]|uniref:Uncharacterized protein n=1 Tax=Medicago truncatula TaxID=3880 RepID=A0A072VFA5_MEDTR|nr:hypothetical protein MTR_1g029300 [Medicago truncatula]